MRLAIDPPARSDACRRLALMLGVLLAAFGAFHFLAAPAEAASPQRGSLANVKRWAYQLQYPDLATLALAPHDLLVIDFSRSGGAKHAYTAAEIDRLKVHPDGSRRLVLAYLSVGEAEVFRDYWRWYWGGTWSTRVLGWLIGPAWLGAENADWPGNFAVRYWHPGWQKIILGSGKGDGYLDAILQAGFDGVYLDKIDSSIQRIARGRPSARDDMRDLVRRIAEKGRSLNPGFLVVPQNGEELLIDESYLEVIDGLGKEDLLFGDSGDGHPNPEVLIEEELKYLRRLTSAGKTVLAVEYLDDEATIARARERLEGFGFVPYFADRDLATLRFGDTPETARR